MLSAVIFDFDGVICDTEPLHLTMFQKVLGEVGVSLTEKEYYSDYVGFDDKGAFHAVLEAHGRHTTNTMLNNLVERKTQHLMNELRESVLIYPGVHELINDAATSYRLAIVSGALRHEIEFVLEHEGIRQRFEHITSAEDVSKGKPAPDGYLHALSALNSQSRPGAHVVAPDDCLVIEDTIPGIQAAHAAGMKVLAVANTYPLEQLHEADRATTSLQEIRLQELIAHLWGPQSSNASTRSQ